jgi:hypothetical protein
MGAPTDKKQLQEARDLRDLAVEGLEEPIRLLEKNLDADRPMMPAEFRSVKMAMEVLTPGATAAEVLKWSQLALRVASVTTGEIHVEALAVAFKLVNPLA